jgi:hypothetical protein
LERVAQELGGDSAAPKSGMGDDIFDQTVGASGSGEVWDDGEGARGNQRAGNVGSEVVELWVRGNALPECVDFSGHRQLWLGRMEVLIKAQQARQFV